MIYLGNSHTEFNDSTGFCFMTSIGDKMGRLQAAMWGMIVAVMLASASVQGQGTATLVSSSPQNGVTGVSVNTALVLTFSEAMNITAVSANLVAFPSTFVTFTTSWSAGDTVLTCTPTAALPANTMIFWTVDGEAANGDTYDGDFGTFTTGTGGGGGETGGSGTNKVTSFSLFKSYSYDQTSAAAPTLQTDFPFGFIGGTILSSNRTATNITLTIPVTGGVSNLTKSPLSPEVWTFYNVSTNQTTFEATVPQGNYAFTVKATTSNQTVNVNFPSSMAQPNAPHVANYAAAQTVDPSKAFVLQWDAFTSATSTDFVQVIVSSGATNVFQTGDYTGTNALAGTAVSVSIPAGTLKTNLTYDGQIMFVRASFNTNNPGYVTSAARATVTYFSLTTVGGATGSLIFTNVLKSAGSIGMDVLCTSGQTFTLLSSTNVALPVAQWTSLLTTNPTGSRVHYVDPQPATNRMKFYRARSGS